MSTPRVASRLKEALVSTTLDGQYRPSCSGTVPYSSPPSNPFFGAVAGRDEIYATGLRNPWRFSFDRNTGELYVADVGQSEIEEIDIITNGGNYGWRVL